MAAQERETSTGESIAVIGDSPFAAFLAGLLASGHKREIALVAALPSPLRIPHGPAISIAPLLRPESWRLALDATPEALKRLGRIGPRLCTRTEVILAASGAGRAYALEHIRHMGTGFGQFIEPVIPAPAGFNAAYRVRDGHRLIDAAFWAAVPDWLGRQNVAMFAPDDALNLRRDGSATIGGRPFDHVVLADDAAIAAHCDPRDLDPVARRTAATAFRTEPVAPRTDPVILSVGGEFSVVQTPECALDITASGSPAEAAKRAGRFLADPGGLRRAAQSTFETLVPRDGAPVVGSLRQTRATVLMGLGPQALFLAPVVARLITGQATDIEQAWAEARRPSRDFSRSRVAEYIEPEPLA